MAALGATPITETYIHGDPGERVDGLAERGRVWINPIHQTVDTVLHELLHIMHPAWTEEYVRNRVTYLMNRLTPEETQTIYAAYQAKARPSKKAKKA